MCFKSPDLGFFSIIPDLTIVRFFTRNYYNIAHQYLKINHKIILIYFQIFTFNILYIILHIYICNNKKKDKSHEIIENLGYIMLIIIVPEKGKLHLIKIFRSSSCFQFEN